MRARGSTRGWLATMSATFEVLPSMSSTSDTDRTGPSKLFGSSDVFWSLGPDVRLSVVPAPQAYYWTPAWQREERESVRELDAGEGRRFEDIKDAIRWLLNDED